MTAPYGNFNDEGYPLAVWLWGHRLREGQHWMEYLLEFLNVLVGFEFELGQGIGNATQLTYRRLTRLGLRRFVFYDEREKTRHPKDDRARQLLLQALKSRSITPVGINSDDPLVLARHLLRSYSAIEDKRSWYAKSLFPVHENLLFWEALRKGATKRESRESVDSTSAHDLDVGVTFGERNFFARGGEIYYLILSAGTKSDGERRNRIISRLQYLLRQRNQEIGEVAEIIDRAWRELKDRAEGERGADDHDEAKLGWIPAPDCELYQIISQDVDNLLRADLDPLESLELLAHLMCFHIVQYIYHRAVVDPYGTDCATGKCLDQHHPLLLVDCLDGHGSGIIRQLSAALYREHEQLQIQAARNYVCHQIQSWAASFGSRTNFAQELENTASAYFNIGGLEKATRQQYHVAVAHLVDQLQTREIDRTKFIDAYTDALTELLMNGFNRHFIGVHRKLGRYIGLIAPRTGRNPRYVLGDTLLKALVLANVPDRSEIAYDDLLVRLYHRYGIVVGQNEAQLSGLYNRKSVNAGYYDDNRLALLGKMKSAGLLYEYSDATAMVRPL